MTETIKLTMADICRHEPKCRCTDYLYVTVPDYKTYHHAVHWLRNERQYKFIPVEGVFKGNRHTGAYTFKFLCRQEYNWFVLRWLS